MPPMKRALQPSRELENRPGKAISYVSEKGLLSLESCHLITEQAMVAAKWVSPAQSPHPKVTHPATLGSIHYASRTPALSGPLPALTGLSSPHSREQGGRVRNLAGLGAWAPLRGS